MTHANLYLSQYFLSVRQINYIEYSYLRGVKFEAFGLRTFMPKN